MNIHKKEKDRVEVTYKEALNLQCVGKKLLPEK